MPYKYIKENNSLKVFPYEFYFYPADNNKERTLAPRWVSTFVCLYVYKYLKTAKPHSPWHHVTECAQFPWIKCGFFAEGLKTEGYFETKIKL